ncbi:MAG: 16S rRNA (guanine(966)-N(2))-methyltransferase RsmD [Gammaproteobacteria bacterium]|nr:16S rRNA (guanine(966)-N(2))-methyltransferase RsmD [Gammaproteobacteria bacterium]
MRRTGYQRRQTGGSGRRNADERNTAARNPAEPGSGKAAARPPGRIRIISGRFRGRRIPVAGLPGLRPTPERTRETLFNWLQGHLDGARVLDLFAGSGALGFEALSRGAGQVVLVERDRRACLQLSEVAASLDPVRCEVVQADALSWPRSPTPRFDLILIDPPFAAGLAAAALAHIHARGLLAVHGRVYCEASARDASAPWDDPASGSWQLLRETRAGDSHGALLAAAGSAPAATL